MSVYFKILPEIYFSTLELTDCGRASLHCPAAAATSPHVWVNVSDGGLSLVVLKGAVCVCVCVGPTGDEAVFSRVRVCLYTHSSPGRGGWEGRFCCFGSARPCAYQSQRTHTHTYTHVRTHT